MAKRTNVILDEKLLEEARRVTGERTYSATITKALEDVVRRNSFRDSLRRLQELAKEGPIFDEDYVKERWPEAAARLYAPKRASAHERRAPKARKRGTR